LRCFKGVNRTKRMNFAYIDARSLLEGVLQTHTPAETRVDVVPHDLEPEWIQFEKELSNFKQKFIVALNDAQRKRTRLDEKVEELNVVKMMIESVTSPSLKDMLASVVDSWETEEGIDALSQQCGEAMGKAEAYKKVIFDTNAERYAKFTCFVCMDKMIDLFIDPCGHVICERCWVRTTNKTHCPGCRTRLIGAKKIFTLN